MVHFTDHIADECRRCVSYGICVFADLVRKRRGLIRIQKGSDECKEALEKNGAVWGEPSQRNASSDSGEVQNDDVGVKGVNE